MIDGLETGAIPCVPEAAYANLVLMNDIYFRQMPQVGDAIVLVEWEFREKIDTTERVLGPATITRVERRTESEWNPVLKEQQEIEQVYVTLLFNDKPYLRRAIVNAAAPPGDRDSVDASPDLPSPPPAS